MSNNGPADPQRAAREERWRQSMRSAQEGDQAAYAALLKDLVPALRRIVQRRWRDPDEVEDIVQDVLLSMHTVRHTYDPKRPFVPWIMTIAHRRIADTARRKYSRARNETTVDVMPETFADDDTKSDQEKSEDRSEVRRALSTLSASQRQAVELTKLEGLSLEEASSVTGKSVASLKVSVHRALKSMRSSLDRKK